MKLDRRAYSFIGVAVAVIIAAFLVYWLYSWAYPEGFQGELDPQVIKTMGKVCAERKSCSECLTKVETVREGEDSRARRLATCGWCPGAGEDGKGRCVARADTYPIVPRAISSGPPGEVKYLEPIFTCPVNTFVSDKSDCGDVACEAFRSCRECAGYSKCGWCAGSNTCVPKSADGQSGAPPAGTTCTGDFVKLTSACPVLPCDKITSCLECAATPGCGYCPSNKKCLKSAMTSSTDEKCGKQTENGFERETLTTSPGQCEGEVPKNQVESTKNTDPEWKKNIKPYLDRLSAAQDNQWSEGGGTDAQDTAASGETGETGETDITAPGSTRPLGSSSERPNFPDNVSVSDDRPFETYVQMLVRSEMAAQGVRTNEPFHVQQVIQNVSKAVSNM